MNMNTGRRLMAPLRSSLTCSPVEGLHASQVATTKHAHRRAKLGSLVLWNVECEITC